MVDCIKLGPNLPGMDRAPYKDELGQKIYESVSQQAWNAWLEQQKMLLNEYRLSPMDPEARKFLEEQTEKYFFGEGVDLPDEYLPPEE